MNTTFMDEKNVMHVLRLFDLLENRQYGDFTSNTVDGVLKCSVQEATCHSEGEWHKLAKQYMEE